MLGFGSGNLLNDPYCTCLCSVSISSHDCFILIHHNIQYAEKFPPYDPYPSEKTSLSEAELGVRRQSAGLRWLNEGGSHFGWEKKPLEITGPPSNGIKEDILSFLLTPEVKCEEILYIL